MRRLLHFVFKEYKSRKLYGEPAKFHKPDSKDPYIWWTYAEVGDKIDAIARGLASLGIRSGDCVGLWSVNRMDWAITDYACAIAGFVSVPLYDTLGMYSRFHLLQLHRNLHLLPGPDAVQYAIGHSETRVVVASVDHIPQVRSFSFIPWLFFPFSPCRFPSILHHSLLVLLSAYVLFVCAAVATCRLRIFSLVAMDAAADRCWPRNAGEEWHMCATSKCRAGLTAPPVVARCCCCCCAVVAFFSFVA